MSVGQCCRHAGLAAFATPDRGTRSSKRIADDEQSGCLIHASLQFYGYKEELAGSSIQDGRTGCPRLGSRPARLYPTAGRDMLLIK